MVEIAVLREPLTGILPYYDPVDDAHQFLVTRAVEVDFPAPFIRQPEHGLFALSRIGVRRQPRRDTLLLFAYPAERPEELRCLGHFISVQRRSEERRVGKEGRSRGAGQAEREKTDGRASAARAS